MSNQVSELYNSVIETVMREARSEFEESGDDPYILQTLKLAWKKRLMEMNISKQPLWVDSATELATSTNNSDSTYQGNNQQDALLYQSMNAQQSQPETQQPFDMLSNNQQQQHQNQNQNQSEPQSNMAYNPLSSIKKEEPSQFNLSPELHAQLQDAMNKPNNYGQVPQHDGQDDELNSDLDDSEDELNSNDEEEDSDQTQLMLCLYEKVHKVKTRWKYTLKDGVANVNGLDYVFNKATGESEW